MTDKLYGSSQRNNNIGDLYNLPTLKISRSQPVDITALGLRCINLIGGVTLTLLATQINQQLLVINTSGVLAMLQSAALIGGNPTHSLPAGNLVDLQWNGSTFVIQ